MSLSLEILSLSASIEHIDTALSELQNVKVELEQKLGIVNTAIQSLENVKLTANGKEVSDQIIGIKKSYGSLKQQIVEVLEKWGPIGNKEIFEKITQNGYQTSQTKINSTLSQYTKSKEFIKIARGLYDLASKNK